LKKNLTIKMIALVLVLVLVSGLGLTGCSSAGGSQVGWSGPTIVGGSIYVGSPGKLAVLNTVNGNFVWQKAIETSGSSGGFGCAAPASSILIFGNTAVAGDLVYAGGYNDGVVRAYVVTTGALRWVYPRSGSLGYAIIGGIVAADGRVYVCTAGGTILALDATTGDFVWEYDIGEQVWATPFIDNGTLYIGSFNRNFYAIDTSTGKAKWQQPFTTGGPITSTPVVSGSTIYLASFDRHVYALDKNSGQMLWQYPSEGAGATPEKWFWAGLVISSDKVFAANMDGKLYVLDGASGAIARVIDLGAPVSSTPVAASGKVYIATGTGKVFSIDTASFASRELANLGLAISAPLAVDTGVLYIHTLGGDAIYAINVETGTSLWNTPLGS
jgi:outer membrane protein assembly factor BamB